MLTDSTALGGCLVSASCFALAIRKIWHFFVLHILLNVSQLAGATGLERLRFAHVCVVGLGGVGSWAVEALARSGIGALTLVDLDEGKAVVKQW